MARFRRRNSGASFGRWRFAGGGMRSILNAGLAAVVGTLLCFGLSSALAQKSNQANKLEDKFLKLYDAGRYADRTAGIDYSRKDPWPQSPRCRNSVGQPG